MSDPEDRPGDDIPLGVARAWLMNARHEGTTCPCCTQRAQVYRRKLYYAMAHTLVLLYEYFATHDGWLHVPTYLNGRGVAARGGDWAKMTHWGLIVGSGETREDDSGRVGEYQITELGIAFVERSVTVPAYMFFYNGEAIGRSDERVYIDAALGKQFNYAELMSGIARPVPGPPGQVALPGIHE